MKRAHGGRCTRQTWLQNNHVSIVLAPTFRPTSQQPPNILFTTPFHTNSDHINAISRMHKQKGAAGGKGPKLGFGVNAENFALHAKSSTQCASAMYNFTLHSKDEAISIAT